MLEYCFQHPIWQEIVINQSSSPIPLSVITRGMKIIKLMTLPIFVVYKMYIMGGTVENQDRTNGAALHNGPSRLYVSTKTKSMS